MHDLFKYSFPELVAIWVQHQKQQVEHFDINFNDPDSGSSSGKKILGIGVALFIILLVIAAGLWILSLVLLIKNAPVMPQWAVILGVIGLFLPGPGAILTILLALMARRN